MAPGPRRCTGPVGDHGARPVWRGGRAAPTGAHAGGPGDGRRGRPAGPHPRSLGPRGACGGHPQRSRRLVVARARQSATTRSSRCSPRRRSTSRPRSRPAARDPADGALLRLGQRGRGPARLGVRRGGAWLRRPGAAARGAAGADHRDLGPAARTAAARADRGGALPRAGRASCGCSSCSSSGPRSTSCSSRSGRTTRCASAPTRRLRCGTPASRSRWRGGASPAPATSTTRRRRRWEQRLWRCTGRAATSPASDLECIATIRGAARGHPCPRPPWRLPGRSTPGCARWWPTPRSRQATRTRRTRCSGSRRRPVRATTPCSPGTACACSCWRRRGTSRRSRGARRGSRRSPDEAVTYGTVDHLGVVDHFLACGYAAVGDPRALEHAERAVVLNERLQCAPWRRRSEALVARLS